MRWPQRNEAGNQLRAVVAVMEKPLPETAKLASVEWNMDAYLEKGFQEWVIRARRELQDVTGRLRKTARVVPTPVTPRGGKGAVAATFEWAFFSRSSVSRVGGGREMRVLLTMPLRGDTTKDCEVSGR
jgi:hypothetical protein